MPYMSKYNNEWEELTNDNKWNNKEIINNKKNNLVLDYIS